MVEMLFLLFYHSEFEEVWNASITIQSFLVEFLGLRGCCYGGVGLRMKAVAMAGGGVWALPTKPILFWTSFIITFATIMLLELPIARNISFHPQYNERSR